MLICPLPVAAKAALKKKPSEPAEARVVSWKHCCGMPPRAGECYIICISALRAEVMLMLDAEGEPIAEVLKQIARREQGFRVYGSHCLPRRCRCRGMEVL